MNPLRCTLSTCLHRQGPPQAVVVPLRPMRSRRVRRAGGESSSCGACAGCAGLTLTAGETMTASDVADRETEAEGAVSSREATGEDGDEEGWLSSTRSGCVLSVSLHFDRLYRLALARSCLIPFVALAFALLVARLGYTPFPRTHTTSSMSSSSTSDGGRFQTVIKLQSRPKGCVQPPRDRRFYL